MTAIAVLQPLQYPYSLALEELLHENSWEVYRCPDDPLEWGQYVRKKWYDHPNYGWSWEMPWWILLKEDPVGCLMYVDPSMDWLKEIQDWLKKYGIEGRGESLRGQVPLTGSGWNDLNWSDYTRRDPHLVTDLPVMTRCGPAVPTTPHQWIQSSEPWFKWPEEVPVPPWRTHSKWTHPKWSNKGRIQENPARSRYEQWLEGQ